MSLSSWSSFNSSILAWNSSTERKMCLSREITFLNFQATYLPSGTNRFFVAEWIALGLTCPGGLQVCLQLHNYTIHTKPRVVEDKFFLALLDPFMVAKDLLAHFQKDFDMLSKLMQCRVISLYPFPTKISSCGAETSLNFINTKPEPLSLGIAVNPRSFICLSAKRVSSGSF